MPHRDKRTMEGLLWEQTKREGKERAVGAFVIVRPTFLTGARKGVQRVRWGGEGRPAVGYRIGRRDVGQWVFEKVVMGRETEERTVGRDVAVTLSY